MIFDLSKGNIPKKLAEIQTKTCNKICEMLKTIPGVILGDDVGMGKTYEAIATAIIFLKEYPSQKIYIITPNWNLNEKWFKDLNTFIHNNLIEKNIIDRTKDIGKIEYNQYEYGSFLDQFKNFKSKKIIISPINVFGSRCSVSEKKFYLLSWCKYHRRQEKTKREILDLVDLETCNTNPDDIDCIGLPYDELPKEFFTCLDSLYEKTKFEDKESLENALLESKYLLLRDQIKDASLLILDEAHKFKNDTVKRKRLLNVFKKKFQKSLFLTATPFQLGFEELKSVLEMFSFAKMSSEKKLEFKHSIINLISVMTEYKNRISDFQNKINYFSEKERLGFIRLFNGIHDENIPIDSCEAYNDYLDLRDKYKNDAEKQIRHFIIRNIKEKDFYRKEIAGSLNKNKTNGIELTEESYIPFALMEKFIYDIYHSGSRTFVSTMEQTFTSSYEALNSSLVNSSEKRKKSNQSLGNLLRILNLPYEQQHPKMKKIVEYLSNTTEKVLIFCNRVETIKKLCDLMNQSISVSRNEEIKKYYSSEKAFKNYCKRFYSNQDVNWFLLQENYIYTVLLPCLKIIGKEEKIPKINVDNVITRYSKFNKTKKTNYLYVKRLVEQECLTNFSKSNPNWKSLLKGFPNLIQTVEAILSDTYITSGFSSVELEEDNDDFKGETKNINEVIQNIISYKGIWDSFKNELNLIVPKDRESLVNALIGFLRRDGNFFIDLKKEQSTKEVEIAVEDIFNAKWADNFLKFINDYTDQSKTEIDRNEMLIGLKENNPVDKIYGNTTEDSKRKIQAGFNSFFNPKVLVVSPVMQEGVDLHKECKTIIHYDLDWNPASMEQRNGRIDRIGSLISRLVDSGDTKSKMNIYYPFIKNTIDEHIYNIVKDREKWFNLLLGGTPEWNSFNLNEEIVSIPAEVYKQLQINLRVE